MTSIQNQEFTCIEINVLTKFAEPHNHVRSECDLYTDHLIVLFISEVCKHDKGVIPTKPTVEFEDNPDDETVTGMGNNVSRQCSSSLSNTKHQAELGGKRDGYDGNSQCDTENTVRD